MVERKSFDIIPNAIKESQAKARRRIDVDTLEHTEARDIGAEWLCLQAVRQLKLEGFLRSIGWTEEDVKIAMAHLITRTIYTPSELKSMRIMQENSGICELMGLSEDKLTPRNIYSVADRFLEENKNREVSLPYDR